MSSDDDVPLYLGLGACHELGTAGKRKPPRRKEPIGFVHFKATQPAKSSPRTAPKPPVRHRKAR